MFRITTRLTRGSRIAAVSMLVGLAMTVAVTATLGSTGNAASPAAPASAAAAGGFSGGVVAQNAQGVMTSRIVGETRNGRTVTGKFFPTDFIRGDGKIRVRGLLAGVVHNADGTTSTFTAMRTLRVARINGTPITTRSAGAAAATCDVLHLRLAPLDLDLLGLVVHLDRVVLDIVARSGAGDLLGNLLCAVTGLLDGGLDGLLGRITRLLDRVLGVLRSGV